jgi:pilus assembly protein Flp/PilA
MRQLVANLRRFRNARAGTTAIEYAIIAAGIAGVIITAVSALGGSVTAMWTAIAGIFS